MRRVVLRMDGTAYGGVVPRTSGAPELMERINRLRENHKVIARRRANARRRVFDKIILQILYFMI